jgi:selenium-binding protein 1
MHLPLNPEKDELHHSGWNACSSCCSPGVKRDKLIFPCLNSDRIFIVDVGEDPLCPKLYKTIEPKELHDLGISSPHTTHCLANGFIMISTMGNGPEGLAQGQFLILDSKDDFKVKGTWSDTPTPFGYDFWYQPKFDVMISSEWGAPKAFKSGLNPATLSESKKIKHLIESR